MLPDEPDSRPLLQRLTSGASLTDEDVQLLAELAGTPLQDFVRTRMACTNERRLFLDSLFRNFPQANLDRLLSSYETNNHSPISYRVYRRFIAQRSERHAAIKQLLPDVFPLRRGRKRKEPVSGGKSALGCC